MAKKHLSNGIEAEELISTGHIIRDTGSSLDATRDIEQAPPILDEEVDTLPIERAAMTGIFKPEERSISFSGTALSALSNARTVGHLNEITKSTLTIGDVVITSSAAKKIGVGEAKLLRYGVSAFTDTNAQNTNKPRLRIYADTKEYARACKVAIDPERKATPEEQEAENKRAAKALENFLAKLGKNAKNLSSGAAWYFKETIRGKVQSYNGMSFISAFSINSDVIMLEFSQSAAEYMIRLPLSDTPRAYYAIDDRKPNAFAIAEALIRHYGMDNNVIKNTERILKVETILKHTSFPTIEEIRKKRTTSWLTLVKEPFEAAMDELYQKHLIAEEKLDRNGNRISGGWRYSLSGMEELSDEQASNILRYEQFCSLYIVYELSGFESHEVRASKIATKRAAQLEKAQEKGRKSTKRKDSSDEN